MSPEERQLITGLFDRMRGFTLAEKDGEAEALINEQTVSQRDAPYMLVQSVLVQEQALQQADVRIRQLEDEVRTLRSGAQPQSAASGGFLGGRPAAEPPRGASVPTIGARATPPAYGNRGSLHAVPQTPQAAGAQQPGGGGGFMQNAMATAAGVAGGMLVGSAIGSLLGGGSSASAATPQTSDPQAAASDSGAPAETAQQQPAEPDPSAQDAADDGGGGWFDGWFGGGDGDGGDFEL